MAKKPLIPVTPSSGNVFADIGVPEPEEELAKAQFATHIRRTIMRRRSASNLGHRRGLSSIRRRHLSISRSKSLAISIPWVKYHA